MRELKRSSIIKEELKVGDEVIKINLNPNELLNNFRKKQLEIVRAEQEVRKLQQEGVKKEKLGEAIEIYGQSIISLFELIFGEENTIKILNFYEGNYTEMAQEVIPYINETITPKIQEVAKEKKKKLRKKFNPKRNIFK